VSRDAIVPSIVLKVLSEPSTTSAKVGAAISVQSTAIEIGVTIDFITFMIFALITEIPLVGDIGDIE
jgi:hypothetical protein